MRTNIQYWEISLKNREPAIDDYYVIDDIIVNDTNFIKNVDRLRDLIIAYCVVLEKSKSVASDIFEEIYQIVTQIKNIQYMEFVAFWKVFDISHSIFKKLPDKKEILHGLLKYYAERRRKMYEKIGYSNVTCQALYDSGASRKKGVAGIIKITEMFLTIFPTAVHLKNLNDLNKKKYGYLTPDKGDSELFSVFRKNLNIKFQFFHDHQEKLPDFVIKIDKNFYIIEAKHIKEGGGAQDKQIGEIIEFIRYCEENDNIHYITFMDGIYINKFIEIKRRKKKTKLEKQKEDIIRYLNENPSNYFLNTIGFEHLLTDLSKKI